MLWETTEFDLVILMKEQAMPASSEGIPSVCAHVHAFPGHGGTCWIQATSSLLEPKGAPVTQLVQCSTSWLLRASQGLASPPVSWGCVVNSGGTPEESQMDRE